MQQVKFYLGLNDKDTHQQEITTNNAITQVVAVFKEYSIDCLTLYQVTGLYQGEAKTTLIIEVLIDYLGDTKTREICRALATIFNQHEVIATNNFIKFITSKN